MPYSIWITQARSFESINRNPATEDADDVSVGMDRPELDDLLGIMDAVDHPQDNARWLYHPDTGTPWCSVFTTPASGPLRNVELSTSFTSPEFPRNMADMFDLALRLAERLKASVFEEFAGCEVTTENIDGLLDLEGEFVAGQMQFWDGIRNKLLAEFYAPLEFPLGATDMMNEYFMFAFLPPKRGILRRAPKLPSMEELLADTPSHLIPIIPDNSAVLEDRESGEGAVRILPSKGGYVVRPYWSSLPFSQLARETLAMVDRVSEKMGIAPLHARRETLTSDTRAEIDRCIQGLGVDFVESFVKVHR